MAVRKSRVVRVAAISLAAATLLASARIVRSQDFGLGAAEIIHLPAFASGNAAAAPAEAALDIAALQERLAALEAAEAQRADAELAKQEADAKKPTVKWAGQLQADFYWFNQDDANVASFGDIENGEAFRRARFGMLGDYGPTEYRIEMDFALSGRPSFLDVYGGVHDLPVLGRVRVGHFFEPFSLERLTPNRYVTLMERSLVDQPFAPARNMGIMANNNWLGDDGAWGLGFFRSGSDAFGDDVGDHFESAVTGRVSLLPYYDAACGGRRYVHVGANYSIRGTNGGVARFQSQPEARVGATSPNVPFFVDTGNIPADFFQLAGADFAWVNGPFSLQAEYLCTSVDADNGTTPFFGGWYAVASYFLTGEHRPYRKDIGVFDRVIPCRDFVRYVGKHEDGCVARGPGAWEIAFRVSQLDLNDSGVAGGEMTDVTAGLNWYLNPYLRFTTNYIHAFVENPAGVDSGCDIFAMRIGFDF